MARFLIDHDGKVWSADDDRLLEAIGYPDPDFEILSYAVRNLGAIAVELADGGAVVQFRSVTVRAEALRAAAEFLSSMSPARIVVQTGGQEQGEQHFDDAVVAHNWLIAQSAAVARNVIIEPRSLTSIANRGLSRLEANDDYFTLLFKKWRISGGHAPPDLADFLVRFAMYDRATIASTRTDGQLMFDHIGARITLYDTQDKQWAFRMQGRPVREQPNPEFGKYTESMFRRILDKSEPAFDHVNAVISDPSGAIRFSYDRLLLPWTMSRGQRLLTSLSFKTAGDQRVSA
jgi:hypothetical protein